MSTSASRARESMYFNKFSAKNYKSFFDWTECRLSKGINLIVGKNSAGKSALLDMLTLAFSNNSHRSMKSKPRADEPVEEYSEARFVFSFSKRELLQIMKARSVYFPFDDLGDFDQSLKKLRNWLLEEYAVSSDGGTLAISVNYEEAIGACIRFCKGNSDGCHLVSGYPFIQCFDDWEDWEPDSQQWQAIHGYFDKTRKNLAFPESTSLMADKEFFPSSLVPSLQNRIYRFSAERFKSHTCSINESPHLRHDASNLPKALGELYGIHGSGSVNQFNRLVHEVFPEIWEVGTISANRGTPHELNIMVWPVKPETKRSDLKIHLKDCGNGVGQVLAILYILVTSPEDESRIIIIDEPTSFLHSTSTKNLMKILARYPQHQIIIATHSPLVVNTVKVSTVTRVSCEDGVSTLESLEPPNEYGYQGWTVEQILKDIMQFEDTRSDVYHKAIDKFEKALDDEDRVAANEAFEELDKMLHPQNEMRALLKLQMISLAGSGDDQD